MYYSPKIIKYNYLHTPSDEKIFYFPLTGIAIHEQIHIGKTEIIPIDKLDNSLNLPQIMMQNVKCIAKTQVSVSENWRQFTDNFSIALQLTKQCIGALYFSFYKCNIRPDDNRRIVISNIGEHEVDEGLVPYYTNKANNIRDLSSHLTFKSNDMSLDIIREINFINSKLNEFYSFDCEYGNKILKSFELLYCVNNEIYSNERILKICAVLNMLFRTDSQSNFPWISNQIHQLFNRHSVDVKSKFPTELIETNDDLSSKKLNVILNEIHNEIRNNFMHGKINLYTEFTVINTEELLFFVITLYELLNIMTSENYYTIKTTKEFIEKLNQDNRKFYS